MMAFWGGGNERRTEKRRGGEGCSEREGGRGREGRTVAKIKSQETSFDICPFCSGIARPDQIYCTREASVVAASVVISMGSVYNRGGGGGACLASARGEKGLKEYFYGRQKGRGKFSPVPANRQEQGG